MMMRKFLIECHNLYKSLGKKHILQGASFKVCYSLLLKILDVIRLLKQIMYVFSLVFDSQYTL